MERMIEFEDMQPDEAENFMKTIAANIDNKNLSDKDFREFIRNTLPIIQELQK